MFRKTLSIDLVERAIYLRGKPKDKQINILRGAVRLFLPRSTIIQSISIQFVGISKTLWPEASERWDRHTLVDSTIPITKESIVLKRGTHTFPFEILLSNALSESIDCGLGHVRYKLHCQVHVKRKFLNLTLQTQRAIMLIRLPSFESQQQCITQTHLINNTGGQLTLMVEKSNITPGILLPIYFSINYSCLVHTVDHLSVKLIERQKYKAPEKQTSRILHNEISLSPTTPFVFGHDENNHNYSEIRTVYVIPDKHTLKVHPSTTYSNIRVRHWLQIYLRLLLKDGTFKDLHIDAPVYVFLASSSDCSILPVYESAPSTSAVASPNYHQRAINEHENLGNRIICRSISSSNFLCSLTKPTSWLKKASHTVKNGKKKSNALMMLMTDPPPCYEEALVGTSN